MMGKNFRDTLEEQLRDPEFRAEIEALKPKRETGLKAETIKISLLSFMENICGKRLIGVNL